jgi:DNA-binding GntR family transcriptional regulator
MRSQSASPSNDKGARTLADTAYGELRRQILLGTRPPGSPLRLERLKEELGMGFSPLREAMMRLRSEGLLEVHGQRGFRVAPATPEKFDDLMISRARIEALLLEDAIRCGDEDWEARVVADFHRLSRRERTDPATGLISEGWDAAHRAFHYSLVAASDSDCLKGFWEPLFDQAQRYRQITVTRGSTLRDDHAEHQRLMETVINRDLPEALAASRKHIENTRALVRRLMFDGSANAAD